MQVLFEQEDQIYDVEGIGLLKPLLNDITIEITNHCQLHCQHCGIWAEKERHEMTASMVVRMMRELLDRYRINLYLSPAGNHF